MAYGPAPSMSTMPAPASTFSCPSQTQSMTIPIQSVFAHGGAASGFSRPVPGHGKMPVTPPTPPQSARITPFKAAPPPTSKEAATLRMNARRYSESLGNFIARFFCNL